MSFVLVGGQGDYLSFSYRFVIYPEHLSFVGFMYYKYVFLVCVFSFHLFCGVSFDKLKF